LPREGEVQECKAAAMPPGRCHSAKEPCEP